MVVDIMRHNSGSLLDGVDGGLLKLVTDWLLKYHEAH